MQVQLVGRQRLQFKSQSGQEISGTNAFVLFPDENVEGFRTERLFIRDGIELPDIRINDKLDISFNYKGKIESVTKIGK